MAAQRLKSNALPGVMLVIIVIWALSAVLMLTSTLASAQRIEDHVNTINGDVAPINTELDTVPVLVQVSKTAQEIRAAAAPLTGQIATVVDNVGTIDTSAKSILVSANSINGWVKTINTSAKDINGSVHSIGSRLNDIEGSANSINGSVHTIDGSFNGITSDVTDIRTRIVRASLQVDSILGFVGGIKQDTGTITGLVDQINANAKAIRASPVVLNPANAQAMSQVGAQAMAAEQQQNALAGIPLNIPLLPNLALPPLPDLSKLLPQIPLTQDLPLLGGSLLDTSFLNDTGDLLGLLGAPPR